MPGDPSNGGGAACVDQRKPVNALSIVSLRCDHCGATLELAEDARFVTCGYCNTRLVVEHKGGAAYTKIERELGAMRIERKLERLERDWKEERVELMLRSKDGKAHVPTRSSSFAAYVIGPVMGLVFLAFAGPTGFSVLVALAMTAIGVFAGMSIARATYRYEAAERRYLDERDRLEEALAHAQR